MFQSPIVPNARRTKLSAVEFLLSVREFAFGLSVFGDIMHGDTFKTWRAVTQLRSDLIRAGNDRHGSGVYISKVKL